MTKEQLLIEISKTLKKSQAIALAEIAATTNFSMLDLLTLCYHAEKPIAFRASWILEFVEDKYPIRFIPILDDFIKQLPKQDNDSCQRLFSKILMHISNPKASDIRRTMFNKLSSTVHERIVETMFEWLINPATPVAVRVNCMDVLYYMTPQFPWIKDELLAQIEFYLKDGSAALQSRGKALHKKLID
ncbi:hypothetical protein [Olivibacter domesticus]|uniref:DNA alkylation repair enzyme n=1 Tax=Olivibacter domesticus TaxID=407022 RepID=A0A1H7X0J5_OLID1|nr:hypothetical protein [Olivibacter domesticus]SEM27161.1 hypothetical protein SAMN05661044_04752 [Olivibacter domesticus]